MFIQFHHAPRRWSKLSDERGRVLVDPLPRIDITVKHADKLFNVTFGPFGKDHEANLVVWANRKFGNAGHE